MMEMINNMMEPQYEDDLDYYNSPAGEPLRDDICFHTKGLYLNIIQRSPKMN